MSIVNKGFGLVAAHLYVTKMAASWTNTWVISIPSIDNELHSIAFNYSNTIRMIKQLKATEFLNWLFFFLIFFWILVLDTGYDRRVERGVRSHYIRIERLDWRRYDVTAAGKSTIAIHFDCPASRVSREGNRWPIITLIFRWHVSIRHFLHRNSLDRTEWNFPPTLIDGDIHNPEKLKP